MQRKNSILLKLLKNKQVLVGSVIVLLFVIIALFAPLLAPHDPLYTNVRVRLQPPCSVHPLGTDDLGRDMLSRIMFGARVSLFVGLSATAIGGAAGVMYGIIAGYYGGRLDSLMGRLVDILLAFPGILLAIAIITIFEPGTRSVIIALSIFAVPSFARISRGSTLNVKKLEYIDAVKAVGARDLRIMVLHILPNILSPLVVQAAIFVANAIMITATLSFLGVGVQPPTPEWGTMLASGREFMARAPHLTLYPGLMIFIIVVAINMVGDGLRNALAPKD